MNRRGLRAIIIPPCEREIDSNGAFFKVSGRVRAEKRRRGGPAGPGDNEQETIDRVKQISPGSMSTSVHATRMEIMQLHRSAASSVILRSTATDETMVPLFIS